MDSPPNPPFSGLYLGFGLRIRSAIELPELPGVPDDGLPADLTVVVGDVPAALPGGAALDQHISTAKDAFLLDVPAGRLLARAGASIEVDPSPGGSLAELRLYLLGVMIVAVCHQRSLLPLHAAAIEAGGRAIAFAGPSGSGKSTLAAQLQGRGFKVLTDDLCVARLSPDGGYLAAQGPARIKLWSDSLALLGLTTAGLPRLVEGIDKFSLPAPRDATAGAPLGRIYLLRRQAEGAGQPRRLAGPEAVAGLIASVHHWPAAVALGAAGDHFAVCARLAASCPVFELPFDHDARAPARLPMALEGGW